MASAASTRIAISSVNGSAIAVLPYDAAWPRRFERERAERGVLAASGLTFGRR
jgi:hypothetical protein